MVPEHNGMEENEKTDERARLVKKHLNQSQTMASQQHQGMQTS